MKEKVFFGLILVFLLSCSEQKKEETVTTTLEEPQPQKTEKADTITDSLGNWKWSIMNAEVILKKNEKNYILEFKLDDGSSRKRNVCIHTDGDIIELRVSDDNPYGEYYKINTSGDLEFWDNEGKFDLATVVKKFHYNP